MSFKIFAGHHSMRLEKCHTAKESNNESQPKNVQKDRGKPLSVCVDYPDLSKYPRDYLEYPAKGGQEPKVGEIELVYGSDQVCMAVLALLKNGDSGLFSQQVDKGEFKFPKWTATSVELPEGLSGSAESVFDFNNDGKLDRVFSQDFDKHYMEGSVLLVQPGQSSSELKVSGSPMDDTSVYVPFQVDGPRHDIRDYPPFSQKTMKRASA